MNKLVLLATVAACGVAASAQAVVIPANSSFDVGGSVVATGSSFDQATSFTPADQTTDPIHLGGFVNAVYSPFSPGNAGVMTPVNLTTGPTSNTLYTFISGGSTLTFNLNKITQIDRTPANPANYVSPAIQFFGTGLITMSGYTPTKGIISFSTTNTGTGMTATFQSSVSSLGSAVPEPTSWAMFLVGFGTMGYGLRARRRAAVNFA